MMKRASPLHTTAFAVALLLAGAATAAETGKADKADSRSVPASGENVDELIREAQTAVDTRRPDEALALFDKAVALVPDKAASVAQDRAWAHVTRGYIAFKMEDYDEAAADFARAAETCPSVKGPITELWAFSRMKVFWDRFNSMTDNPARADWKGLIQFASETVAIAPDWPETRQGLGAAYEWGGFENRARTEFRTAAKGARIKGNSLDALRDAATESASKRRHACSLPFHPMLKKTDAGEFKVYKQGCFIIHHHNEELARRTVNVLEYYLARPVLDGLLEGSDSLPRECNVFIYRSQKEFMAAQSQPAWADGCFKSQREGLIPGGLELHLQQGAPGMLHTVAPHELGHLRFAIAWSFNSNVTTWLEEGVAMSAEMNTREAYWRRGILRAREKGKLIPFAELMKAGDVPNDSAHEVFYAESLAAVNALIGRGGSKRLWGFITGLQNADQVQSLKRAYGITPEELQRLAVEWAAGGKPQAPPAPVTAKGARKQPGKGKRSSAKTDD